MKSLSILIATIPEREADFNKLVEAFHVMGHRYILGDSLFILSDPEGRGPLSIGAKRQRMLERVQTDYVVFFDDDDWPMPSYVDDIMEAIQKGPDCVGFFELVEGLGARPQLSMWSNRFPKWMHGKDAQRHGVDYCRTPFHKTPIRTDIAKAIGFKDMRFAEDHDFSVRLKVSGMCKKEEFITKVLYHYRYINEPQSVKFG